MHPIEAFIRHPIKVCVGVILVGLFGVLSIFRMPMQLTPEVERPTITVTTRWPGASPQEIEKEIVQRQEEQLQSVQGVSKLSSQNSDSQGSITLEFNVGADMEEAVLRVNSQLQQVGDYPVDADNPVISTANSSNSPIAWFILSAKPATDEKIREFQETFPEHREALQRVLDADNPGLATLRVRKLSEDHPELAPLLPPEIDVPTWRKFAEDQIESRFEHVTGVADSEVVGGRDPEVQVIVDPEQLSARGLTLSQLRNRLRSQNADTSGGDLWDGKRRYVVRTLGQYRELADVENVVVAIPDGQPVLLKDVAQVVMTHKKPSGFVRRFGTSNIACNVQRETGANVLDVMDGLRAVNKELNEGLLAQQGLVLTQVYDETDYIRSSINLVNQNIVLGSALTVIVLMLFLHLGARTLIFVPLLAGSAIAALLITPWFFIATLILIVVAGAWYARVALVVSLAIPISIVGTFLILNGLGRSLNVISLAGLAFAVGMLVDNAVVVLENIYRFHQQGESPFQAALRGTKEVWGAVLASTLTTLFVFIPVVFLQGEAGQLFADIALAISSAVALSLLVSVIVIPMASSRILKRVPKSNESLERLNQQAQRFGDRISKSFVGSIVGINRFAQGSLARRLTVVTVLILAALVGAYLLLPKVEYLPTGNRNLVICLIFPPPGYNLEEMVSMGELVESELQPYWDNEPGVTEVDGMPAIDDFFYVARGRNLFLGVRAADPLKANRLIGLMQERLGGKFPGSFVFASQTSLFERGLSGGRTIDIEISGPDLQRLVGLGGRIMGQLNGPDPDDPSEGSRLLPEGTQMRPEPSLDLASPELHVVARPIPASEMGVNNEELGYAINAIIDGAYVTDYFMGGDKIDLVLTGSKQYTGETQDLADQYVAVPNVSWPVRLGSIADIDLSSGPEQINHRERRRAITITVTPPPTMPLEEAISIIREHVVEPLANDPSISNDYKIGLSGTADKLAETWNELRWNIIVALLVTYLLMAALFESWLYPLVIIVSVPLGAVGGLLGLKLLGLYLMARGEAPQTLDVLTMLGFVILIGTVVNNAILIVHQALNLIREEGSEIRDAVLESVRTRVRPIFMTTTTTVFGLAPLVFFPGAGSELYRGLGAVVLGGLIVSTVFTLILIPSLFTLTMQLKQASGRGLRRFLDRDGDDEPTALPRTEPPLPRSDRGDSTPNRAAHVKPETTAPERSSATESGGEHADGNGNGHTHVDPNANPKRRFPDPPARRDADVEPERPAVEGEDDDAGTRPRPR